MKAPEASLFSPAHPKLPRQLVPRVGYVEDAFEARTKHGKRRVSARWGWAGEKSDFFSILPAWHLSLISNLGTLGQLQQRGIPSKEVTGVKQAMGQLGVGIMLTASLLMETGCGGTGKTVNLDLQQRYEAAQFMEPEPVRIVIESFEDRRPEKNRLGLRTHLWGGVTYFNVEGGRPGDMIAQILADRLKMRGWKNQAWAVQVAPSGLTTNPNNADIVISGQLLDFSANAKSRLFSTVVTTNSTLVFIAKNLADQSSITRSIEGAQRETLFWFSDDDVQQLLAATLKDDIDRYLAETTIENKMLRSTR